VGSDGGGLAPVDCSELGDDIGHVTGGRLGRNEPLRCDHRVGQQSGWHHPKQAERGQATGVHYSSPAPRMGLTRPEPASFHFRIAVLTWEA